MGDTVDETWYPNAGANQHITANVTDAQGKHPYLGQDSIMVGNGDALPISNVASFKISSINVTLSNVLIVLLTIKKIFYWFLSLPKILIFVSYFIHGSLLSMT